MENELGGIATCFEAATTPPLMRWSKRGMAFMKLTGYIDQRHYSAWSGRLG